MAIPLSMDEVGKKIHEALIDSVKSEIPDEPGQTVLWNDEQKHLAVVIINAFGQEMFYGNTNVRMNEPAGERTVGR